MFYLTEHQTANHLHRHAISRAGEDWINDRLRDPGTRFIVNHDGKFAATNDRHLRLLSKDALSNLTHESPTFYYLAEVTDDEEGHHVFCCHLDAIGVNDYKWLTMRYTDPADPLTQLGLHAQGLLNWHAVCRYCERCGSELTTQVDGHSKRCRNEHCQCEVFPRINPAVIVLVTHQNKCLLANAYQFKSVKPMYSCLAGYVETGETFEQTLQREVMEEVGVELQNYTYLCNQPWPFPHSLMIGFHAEAKNTDFTYHDGEIKDARWFTVAELRDALQAQEIELATPQSIAYHLLDIWLFDTAQLRIKDLVPDAK